MSSRCHAEERAAKRLQVVTAIAVADDEDFVELTRRISAVGMARSRHISLAFSEARVDVVAFLDFCYRIQLIRLLLSPPDRRIDVNSRLISESLIGLRRDAMLPLTRQRRAIIRVFLARAREEPQQSPAKVLRIKSQ